MAKIIQHPRDGYYEVADKPDEAELRAYYQQQYYQNEEASYGQQYAEEELRFKNHKIALKAAVAEQLLGKPSAEATLLDIGCGEGFVLKAFADRDWQVLGLDYSDYGCRMQNPDLADRIRAGNIYDNLADLQREGAHYDLIWLDNVLEHVTDVDRLLATCRQLAQPHSVLCITVPNDFSSLQEQLLAEGKIDREFWVKTPDHLAYFTAPSLAKTLEAAGWRTEKILGDFPIDWFLTNAHTNYIADRSKGKAAHQSRLWLYNHLAERNAPEALIAFYESLAGVGMGRNITGFFRQLQ